MGAITCTFKRTRIIALFSFMALLAACSEEGPSELDKARIEPFLWVCSLLVNPSAGDAEDEAELRQQLFIEHFARGAATAVAGGPNGLSSRISRLKWAFADDSRSIVSEFSRDGTDFICEWVKENNNWQPARVYRNDELIFSRAYINELLAVFERERLAEEAQREKKIAAEREAREALIAANRHCVAEGNKAQANSIEIYSSTLYPDEFEELTDAALEAAKQYKACEATELYKSALRIAVPLYLAELEKNRLPEQQRDEIFWREGIEGCPITLEALMEARRSRGINIVERWKALRSCPRPWLDQYQ